MKEQGKKCLSIAAILGGVAMLAAVLLMRDTLPGWATGLLSGLGGAAIGLGGGGTIMGWIAKGMSPKDRAELERGETDERNVTIREKASQDCWYWTGRLLWVPFVVSLVQGAGLYTALSAGVIVLHNVFFLVNLYRWSKRM